MVENHKLWWKHWYQCCEINFRRVTVIAKDYLQPCWKSYFSWITRLSNSSYLTMGRDFTDKGLVHVRGSGPWNDVQLAENTGHLSILNMFIIPLHHCSVKFFHLSWYWWALSLLLLFLLDVLLYMWDPLSLSPKCVGNFHIAPSVL